MDIGWGYYMTPDKLKDWFSALDAFPTTRFRILCTIFLAIGTGVTYLLHACILMPHGWEPSSSFLTFVCVLLGIDVTQYGVRGFIDSQAAKLAATPNVNISQTTQTKNVPGASNAETTTTQIVAQTTDKPTTQKDGHS